jgi:hypothetical protein
MSNDPSAGVGSSSEMVAGFVGVIVGGEDVGWTVAADTVVGLLAV